MKNKVAIVTGSASGIGEATALLFAEEGAKVVVADLDDKGSARTAAQIHNLGGEAIAVPADISTEAGSRAITEKAVEAFARIDILVNNAAAFVIKGLEATVDDWQRSLGTNVIGTALMSRHVVEQMQQNGGGSIVNVSSQSALFAQPGFLTYSTTKAAIIHMTRLMALDLAPANIRVNTVCPGTILTTASLGHIRKLGITVEQFEATEGGQTILKRVGKPREVAQAIAFLASSEASYITAACLLVDGGRTAMG
ncbi:MAG TPA: SDR family oxidoreductase [Bryobacteraceae bacterium]|nr:SDR family oxidoreductase [Bryobacteraceae bacterium]